MNPILDSIEVEDNILNFRIQNLNVSYANAIRRTILSDIPTIVFRTSPYEKNKAIFEINTSKLNNEFLKQRLSCIPIHITDLKIPLDNLLLSVNVLNQSSSVIHVTTDDFKVIDKITNKVIDMKTAQLFPHNEITKSPIDFCRLQPQISDQLKGEHLKFTCEFNIGTAKENGSFNVVSTCTYKCTVDTEKVNNLEEIKKDMLEKKYADIYKDNLDVQDIQKLIDEQIEIELTDWLILEAPRVVIPNSYDFKIQTVGVFDNNDIVKKALAILIDSLNNIISIYSKSNNLIKDSSTFMPNCYDIILNNEDYTIGKVLEYSLHEEYYQKNTDLNFCAFKKFHPHINHSIIRVAFNSPTDIAAVSIYLINSAKLAIQLYQKILYQFGEEEYKSAFTDIQLLDLPVHSIASADDSEQFIKLQQTPLQSAESTSTAKPTTPQVVAPTPTPTPAQQTPAALTPAVTPTKTPTQTPAALTHAVTPTKTPTQTPAALTPAVTPTKTLTKQKTPRKTPSQPPQQPPQQSQPPPQSPSQPPPQSPSQPPPQSPSQPPPQSPSQPPQ